MKKFLLAIVAIGTITTAQAQKGSLLVFGDLGIQSIKDSSENKSTLFSINPGVGFQVSDNFTVGLSGGHTSWADEYKVAGKTFKTSESMMHIGAFARYTQYIVGNIFCIYGQFDAGYMSGNTKTDGKVDSLSKHSGFGASITPAVGINVCHGFALNFSFGGLSFTSDKFNDIPGANPETNINLTFGHQMNFGISKNFNLGHKAKTHKEPMDDTRKLDTKDDEEAAPAKKAPKKDDDE